MEVGRRTFKESRILGRMMRERREGLSSVARVKRRLVAGAEEGLMAASKALCHIISIISPVLENPRVPQGSSYPQRWG